MDIYGNKLVNTIETKPLHISLSNFQDMLTMMRGCTLLILEVNSTGCLIFHVKLVYNGQIFISVSCEIIQCTTRIYTVIESNARKREVVVILTQE